MTRPPCSACGARNAARSSRKTSPATSSSSSGSSPRTSTGAGTSQYRPGAHRRPAPDPASRRPLDGGHPRRHGRSNRGGVRGQVHAAVVVLRRGGGRKIHAAAAAQHVGDQCQAVGALDHHRRRQVGRDQASRPIRSTSTSCSPRRRSSGAASRVASPLACSASSRRGRGSRRCGSST